MSSSSTWNYIPTNDATGVSRWSFTLDRNPDEAGFMGWLDQLEDGSRTEQTLVAGFLNSIEFSNSLNAGNDTASNGDFVDLLYDRGFDRAADAGGFNYWTSQLNATTMTREEVVLGFVNSVEGGNKHDNNFLSFAAALLGQKDILTGGLGDDVFIFGQTFGQDTIVDFQSNNELDRIDLSDVASITSFEDLSTSHLSQTGSDAKITDSEGNSITLLDVSMADLSQEDFVF